MKVAVGSALVTPIGDMQPQGSARNANHQSKKKKQGRKTIYTREKTDTTLAN